MPETAISQRQWKAGLAMTPFSQEEIARRARVSRGTVLALERGNRVLPTVIASVAEVYRQLGITFDQQDGAEMVIYRQPEASGS